MFTILLYILLFTGLIIGWLQGQMELESSKIRYHDKSLLKYFLNL